MNRRLFLALGAGAAVGAAWLGPSPRPSAASSSPPAGPVYGRTGRLGIAGGASGTVRLEGGATLIVSNPARDRIRANSGILLCPEPDGRWRIQYAEFL